MDGRDARPGREAGTRGGSSIDTIPLIDGASAIERRGARGQGGGGTRDGGKTGPP